jgi:hypothetical protein
MDLSGILSLSGKSGLYKSIAQTKNGLIVESLIDQKRFPAYVSDKVSSLEDISVFATDRDLPLKEVFDLIYKKEEGKACIDHKSNDAALKKYFEEVLPDYDKERVYVSDMRKLFMWYNMLLEQGLLIPEETKEEEKAVAKKTEVKKTEKEKPAAKTEKKAK